MADDVRQQDATASELPAIDLRRFVQNALAACAAGCPVILAMLKLPVAAAQAPEAGGYDPTDHWYGMGIDVQKCIGCGRCVAACKAENDVPLDAHHFNTWVERYVIHDDGEVTVDSPNGGYDGFPPPESEAGIRRTFFVPKLCNHCANPPLVRVCPVGATIITPDGVVNRLGQHLGKQPAVRRLHHAVAVGIVPELIGEEVHALLGGDERRARRGGRCMTTRCDASAEVPLIHRAGALRRQALGVQTLDRLEGVAHAVQQQVAARRVGHVERGDVTTGAQAGIGLRSVRAHDRAGVGEVGWNPAHRFVNDQQPLRGVRAPAGGRPGGVSPLPGVALDAELVGTGLAQRRPELALVLGAVRIVTDRADDGLVGSRPGVSRLRVVGHLAKLQLNGAAPLVTGRARRAATFLL